MKIDTQMKMHLLIMFSGGDVFLLPTSPYATPPTLSCVRESAAMEEASKQAQTHYITAVSLTVSLACSPALPLLAKMSSINDGMASAERSWGRGRPKRWPTLA